ncbi:hypothetical protein [Streptomyces sp. NPDC048650]|uniref:hypothetical protein n=1 Tax=unclassified Streptomyces TaxID=2593676 RepID=UPI00371E5686
MSFWKSRRSATAAAVSAAALTALFSVVTAHGAIAQPASASRASAPVSASSADCPPGPHNTCWWSKQKYKGAFHSEGTMAKFCSNLATYEHSVWNRSKYELWMWKGKSCKGDPDVVIPAGGKNAGWNSGTYSFKLIPY